MTWQCTQVRVLAIYKGFRTHDPYRCRGGPTRNPWLYSWNCKLFKFEWVSFIMKGFKTHTPFIREGVFPTLKSGKRDSKRSEGGQVSRVTWCHSAGWWQSWDPQVIVWCQLFPLCWPHVCAWQLLCCQGLLSDGADWQETLGLEAKESQCLIWEHRWWGPFLSMTSYRKGE